MASVFGVGYIIGREHSFEEEEMWEEEAEKLDDSNDDESTDDGQESEVEFELEDEEATKVSLVGTFNDWKKQANPMKKEDGVWKCTLNLKPGKYEYQFVINETDWVVDPKSEDNVKNKYEGMNSVIEVK
jgi:1,4-alpha-glucan branching enzyme